MAQGWSNWKLMFVLATLTVIGSRRLVPPLPSKFMYRPAPRPVTVPLAPRKFER